MLNQTHFRPALHCRNCGEVPHAHQVVGRTSEAEDPVHFADPTMPYLPQQRDRFQPAEAFFDALPLLLTEGIAGMMRRPSIDRTPTTPSQVLRHMRSHSQMPTLSHEIP